MADYHNVLVDASTGNNLAELPLTGVSFSRLLTGIGTLSATMPLDHPAAAEVNFLGDREITVYRDDIAVWNGPITTIDPDLAGRTLSLTAREPTWYFAKRVLEIDKHYNADIFHIVRKLIEYITTKTDTTLGDINADLPRLTVSSGLSGYTKYLPVVGLARRTVQEALDFMVDDPDSGLEYRTDYRTSSTRTSCHRTLMLGAPLGSTLTTELTENILYGYGRTLDWEEAATRVHVRGAGLVATKTNSGEVAAGTLLLERVFDRGDTSDSDTLNNIAREYRRRTQPPVKTMTATYIPDLALPYGFCDPGDTVPFGITTPDMLSVTANNRRVVEETTTPESDGTPELVALGMNLPLSDLGE